MNTPELRKQVSHTGPAIIEALQGFTEQELNTIPFGGSWTGGQVAEHLLKSGGVVEVVFGRTVPTSRPADEQIPTLSIFLNFKIKMQSPDFILPSAGFHAKEPLIEQLKDCWTRVGEAVETLDLTQTCLDFEMPQVGQLTRLEWISFYVFHTQRHLHQLQNIQTHLEPRNITLPRL